MFSTKPHPPGPKGSLLLGSWEPFRKGGALFVQDVIRTYGNTAFLRVAHLDFYVFNEPEHIREVLATQAKSFTKDRTLKKSLGRFIGVGVTAADGEAWKRQRQLVQPAFSSSWLDEYARTMIASMTQLLDRWVPDQAYELESELSWYAMDITCRSMFGVTVDQVADPKILIATSFKMQQVVRDELAALFVGLPMWLPTSIGRRSREVLGVLDGVMYKVMRERRASGERRNDFLSLLLDARHDDGTPLSDKQVRDELASVFVAGQASSAFALCWAWYLLSQHPEIEARLFEEIDRELGQRPLTVADLPRLTYTEMVLKETMRIFPPAPLLAREAIEPVTIGDYRLDKGDMVLISPHAAHRHERYFPDPERFDPERFSPEREKELPHFLYIPFGAGPRRCIGMAYASTSMKVAMAMMAQRFRLLLSPGQQVIPEPLIGMHPKDGLYMRASPRVRSAAAPATGDGARPQPHA